MNNTNNTKPNTKPKTNPDAPNFLDAVYCMDCGEEYSRRRFDLGYDICMDCGEENARLARVHWTVAPLNKSNYVLITDPSELAQLNPKRTT
jgi:hypothetical protein